MIDDPHVIELGARRTLLLHGDTLCTDDTEYQRFRAESRSAAWTMAMLGTPLEKRKQHIQTLREQSEAQKRTKASDIMDVNTAAVAEAFRASGCDLMIHGHTHRPGFHLHQVGDRQCERRVLDAWYEQGSYLLHDAGGFRTVEI